VPLTESGSVDRFAPDWVLVLGFTALPAIGAVFAKNLSSPGSTVSKPQSLDLPAGKAVLITGTVPLPKAYQGAKTGFTLILMLRPGRLYMLSFRIDSRVASDANVFASIAQLFRFV
jgi:hypothetical protein